MTKPYCYDYPRPAVTVDLVTFALSDEGLRVLLIRRRNDPFAGKRAIPGGFLEMEEPIEAAARRELHEETGLLKVGQLAFVGYFGDPGRDPRGRTISFAFAATLSGPPPDATGADDAEDARWLDPYLVSDLAFDHDAILAKALDWLITMTPFGSGALGFLPDPFSTADLTRVCKAIHLVEERENDLLERLVTSEFVSQAAGKAGRYRLTNAGGSA